MQSSLHNKGSFETLTFHNTPDNGKELPHKHKGIKTSTVNETIDRTMYCILQVRHACGASANNALKNAI